jgi:hypothetical protein
MHGRDRGSGGLERSGLGIASRSRVVSTVLQRTGNQSLEQMLKAIREGLAAAKPAPGKEALLDAIKAAADKLAKKQIARICPSGAPMRAQIADIVRALEASAWTPNLVSRTVCMSSPRAATGGDSRRAATKTTASSAACSPKPSGPARRSTRPPQAPTGRVDAADAEIAWTGAISPMARRPLWTCSFVLKR